jgi:GNAT superfamily N-acetyltransferase
MPADMAPLARLWHATWHEAHTGIVPPGLAELRPPESFALRLADTGDRLRVAGSVGAPMGMCIVHGNRIDQLYVAASARGTGLARALLDDGESRLRGWGIDHAELVCAAANLRAVRFYAKSGWRQSKLTATTVWTAEGEKSVPTILFGKDLTAAQPG